MCNKVLFLNLCLLLPKHNNNNIYVLVISTQAISVVYV